MSDPQTRAERGLDCLTTIAGGPEQGQAIADFFESRGALGSLALLTAAGEIWARTQISRRDRSVIVISALTALGRDQDLKQHVTGGLNHGLRVDEIDELMLQIAAYCGIPFALAGSLVVDQAVAERDGTETRTVPLAPGNPQTDEKRRAAGLDVLTTLVGDPNFDKATTEAAILDAQGDMGVLVMDYAFGDVWSRPGLSRRDRSLIVISALTAINMKHELEIHLGAALNHGVTPVEIQEVMITMVAYGGFPRAIDGLILAKQVFEARGVKIEN